MDDWVAFESQREELEGSESEMAAAEVNTGGRGVQGAPPVNPDDETVAERIGGTGYGSVRANGKMLAANKTQCEFVITHVGPAPFVIVGIDDGTADISAGFQIASDVHGYGYYQDTGEKIHSGSLATYGASFKTDGDVITMLYDGTSGTLAFKKNGVSQGTAYTGLSGDFFPAVSIYSGDGSPKAQITLRTNTSAMSYPESGYVGVTV